MTTKSELALTIARNIVETEAAIKAGVNGYMMHNEDFSLVIGKDGDKMRFVSPICANAAVSGLTTQRHLSRRWNGNLNTEQARCKVDVAESHVVLNKYLEMQKGLFEALVA